MACACRIRCKKTCVVLPILPALRRLLDGHVVADMACGVSWEKVRGVSMDADVAHGC